jgi:hypothetical protein
MSKTRHLDAAIAIFRGPASTGGNVEMRGEYENALVKQGWVYVDHSSRSTELHKPGTRKRMIVFSGDRVSISFDGVTWKQLNQHARRNILLGGQS